MAWDKTYPVPTTKIRDLSNGIPDNWDAIETADTTFTPDGLNLTKQGADLSKLADNIRLYTKDDGSGDTQLFAINDASSAVINQLTGAKISNSANGGTAGGTIYKIDLPIDGTTRIIIYSGRTSSFTGSATVTVPETLSTIYTAQVTPDNGTSSNQSTILRGVTTSTIYNSAAFTTNWLIIGAI